MIENDRAGLTPNQERAIRALLTEPSVRAAAKKAKVGEASLYRWLGEPVFATAYKEARSHLLTSTLTALQSAGGMAVETLKKVMDDSAAQASARVSAAKNILEFGLKAREVLEVEERLKAIEERLKTLPEGVKL
jgi:hypothetical protein